MKITITHKHIYILAAILFLCSCWFGIGFRHGDEHYQIFEFAGHILGWNKPNEMAWEFHTQMRPSLQPFLTAFGIHFLNSINIVDPFFQAFLFKCLSAALLYLALMKLTRAFYPNPSTLHLAFHFLFVLTAYVAARYSSEGLATSTFILLVAKLLTANKLRDYFVAGIYGGLAFCFRYQIGFALVGIGLWYLITQKVQFNIILTLLAGWIIPVLIGTVSDYHFYGTWVIAPYNYFYQNIVLNKASNYGTDPWYYYFEHVFNDGLIIPGLLILVAGIVFTYKNPTHIITLSSWCFLLGHMAIAHKETRFLYPIAPFIPIILLNLIHSIQSIKLRNSIIWICIIANAFLMIPYCFFPASQEMSVLKYLEQTHPSKHITLYYSGENDPYEDYGLKNKYYGRKPHTSTPQDSVISQVVANSVWLSYNCHEEGKQVGKYTLKRRFQSYPIWITDFFNINNWVERTSILTVYSIELKK